MIDEKQLEYAEQHGIAVLDPEHDKEIIRLARLGLWAEKYGVQAIQGLLENISLDWYVQQFGRDTTDSKGNSGIVARIHNDETLRRIEKALYLAREALAALPKDEK